MHRTPASLLERLRKPAANAAWARFVDLYTPLLYYWARRMGLPASEAGDLVQDVFVLLMQKLPEFQYDRHRSFRSWLRTLTTNKWRETLRQRAARPQLQNGHLLEELADPGAPDGFEEVEYRQQMVGRALELMQAEFQPTIWKACWEYVVNGRPVKEVAASLGITVSAVYQAKSRVLRRLRQELYQLLD
jgi:RNA polymerase sigma-70 factor (ECF subfamily)